MPRNRHKVSMLRGDVNAMLRDAERIVHMYDTGRTSLVIVREYLASMTINMQTIAPHRLKELDDIFALDDLQPIRSNHKPT